MRGCRDASVWRELLVEVVCGQLTERMPCEYPPQLVRRCVFPRRIDRASR